MAPPHKDGPHFPVEWCSLGEHSCLDRVERAGLSLGELLRLREQSLGGLPVQRVGPRILGRLGQGRGGRGELVPAPSQ